jgi:hypothetical protein
MARSTESDAIVGSRKIVLARNRAGTGVVLAKSVDKADDDKREESVKGRRRR